MSLVQSLSVALCLFFCCPIHLPRCVCLSLPACLSLSFPFLFLYLPSSATCPAFAVKLQDIEALYIDLSRPLPSLPSLPPSPPTPPARACFKENSSLHISLAQSGLQFLT